MPNVLISGPAGAAKSQTALEIRRERQRNYELAIIVDFQALYAAISGDVRGLDGRYPLRDNRLLPTVEYMRQTLITAARNRDIGIIATNSDGDPDRRADLLRRLGPDSHEAVIDPGEATVRARLADPRTGQLLEDCLQAIQRWYLRLRQ